MRYKQLLCVSSTRHMHLFLIKVYGVRIVKVLDIIMIIKIRDLSLLCVNHVQMHQNVL